MNQPANSLNVGDVVQLKSGGPDMTVVRVLEANADPVGEIVMKQHGLKAGDVVCTWFDGETKEEAGFPASAVERVDM